MRDIRPGTAGRAKRAATASRRSSSHGPSRPSVNVLAFDPVVTRFIKSQKLRERSGTQRAMPQRSGPIGRTVSRPRALSPSPYAPHVQEYRTIGGRKPYPHAAGESPKLPPISPGDLAKMRRAGATPSGGILNPVLGKPVREAARFLGADPEASDRQLLVNAGLMLPVGRPFSLAR